MRKMDYSLLMGIRRRQSTLEKKNKSISKQKTVIMSGNLINTGINEDSQSNSSQEASKTTPIEDSHTFFSVDKEWCYQISIIDYLQTFDKSKQREVFAKKYFKRLDPNKISAVKPDPYAKRYMEFMTGSVF